jgi:hypothetical protein
MDKYYIGVTETPENDKTHWSVCLGSPNPDERHYFEVENKEKAFEIQDKLRAYLSE